MKDLLDTLLGPIATILAVLLNGVYFNRRIEEIKRDLALEVEDKKNELATKLAEKNGEITVLVDGRKDIEKRRREALFRLRNLSSIASRLAEKVFVANKLNEKASAVEALLPNLTELWSTTKSIKEEGFNGDMDREDFRPYVALYVQLVDYFFLLDNTKIGQADYLAKLSSAFENIKSLDASLTEHNRKRLNVTISG